MRASKMNEVVQNHERNKPVEEVMVAEKYNIDNLKQIFENEIPHWANLGVEGFIFRSHLSELDIAVLTHLGYVIKKYKHSVTAEEFIWIQCNESSIDQPNWIITNRMRGYICHLDNNIGHIADELRYLVQNHKKPIYKCEWDLSDEEIYVLKLIDMNVREKNIVELPNNLIPEMWKPTYSGKLEECVDRFFQFFKK